MAGIATPNSPTFFQGKAADRGASSPFTGLTTDWDGGTNKGGSNTMGVGVNTGDYDPKATDWSQHVRDPQNSQTIGHDLAVLRLNRPQASDETTSFVQAAQTTAPDQNLVLTQPAIVNRTGKTVPENSWAWGSKAVT